MSYQEILFADRYYEPHFIDEISCSPEKIFKNFSTTDKNKAMEFLEEIKNKYAKEYLETLEISDVIKNFKESLDRFVVEYKPSNAFENLKEYEYHNTIDFRDFFYSSAFFKIIDGASDYYKKNCGLNSVNDNSKIDLNLDYLSKFCNSSNWNLKELVSNHIIFDDVTNINEILASKLLEYTNAFNKHFQSILECFKFFNIVDFLKENNLLLNFLVGLYAVDLNEVLFKDSENFKEFYTIFEDNSERIKRLYNIDKNYYFPKFLFSDVNLKNKNHISIYDPSCASGGLLIYCKKFIETINPNCNVTLYGCCNNPRDYAFCLTKMLFSNQSLDNFSLVDNLLLEMSLKILKENTFDFIISDWNNQEDVNYLGFFTHKNRINLRNKFNEKLVLFTSFSFLTGDSEISNFIEDDILDSIIRLPCSLESGKDGIIILNKNKTPNRKNKFLLIDEYDKNMIYESDVPPKKVIKNILKHYNNFKNYKKGKVFKNSETDPRFSFQGLMYDKTVDSIETDVPLLRFIELIDEDSENKNVLYIPSKLKNFDKIAYFDIPGNNYINDVIPIRLDSIILNEYLYYYLNSNKGKNDISYLTLNFTDIYSIFYLYIPVPPIDEQKRIVDAARKMESFFNAMDIWKNNYSNNILNYKNSLKSYEDFSCTIEFSDNGRIDMCSHWKIVYQGLILPLAAAYLKATMGSNNDDTRKKNYLVLFEFITSFNVIVLISAIKYSSKNIDDYDKILNELWTLKVIGKDKSGNKLYDNKSWHRMSFGSWTTLYGNLNRIFKNYKFTTAMDKEFFETLSSNKYKKLFNKLRHKERNSDAHGGFEDDIDVTIKVQELQKYMDEDIFGILKLYSGLKLYYTTGKQEQITPKQIEYDVISLNGPCNPPMPSKVKTNIQLNAYSLYLYDSINNDFMELDKDLIRFKQIPGSEQYGFYIYDGIDTNENVALYKCYYDEKPWKVPLEPDEDSFLNVSGEFLNQVLRI